MMFGDRVFKEMYDMVKEMEREFDAMRKELGKEDYKMPLVDIYETEDELVIQAEMPGVKKEDIVLHVSPTSVEISAELKQDSEEKRRGYYKKERIMKRFYRNITLPIKVSTDSVKAKFENGVLTIRLKKERSEKRRVEIE